MTQIFIKKPLNKSIELYILPLEGHLVIELLSLGTLFTFLCSKVTSGPSGEKNIQLNAIILKAALLGYGSFRT